MPYLVVAAQRNAGVEIYYEDQGSGRPAVLIHGYPVAAQSWERQQPALLRAGYRVVTYDRRGFGRSSQPSDGYDIDTLAGDLHAFVEHLDLLDVQLIGFSLGSAEAARYIGTYGTSRVSKTVLISVAPPFLVRTPDNPCGVDEGVFDQMRAAIIDDRYAWFEGFLNNAYNVDLLAGSKISDQAWYASYIAAVGSSACATLGCLGALLSDCRADLTKFDVPTLVVHGTEDRFLPIAATADRLDDLMKDVRVVRIQGGPHNITWTHAEEVNRAVIGFLAT